MDQQDQEESDRLALVAQLLMLSMAADRAALAVSDLARLRDEITSTILQSRLQNASRLEVANLLDSVTASVSRSYTKSLENVDFAGLIDEVVKVTGADLETVTGKSTVSIGDIAKSGIESGTLVQGALLLDWWNRLASDSAFRVASVIRAGVASAADAAAIAKQAGEELAAVSARNLQSLTRAGAMALADAARAAVFQANNGLVIGKMQISVLDSATTPTCRKYANAKWDLTGKPIGIKKLPFNNGTPRHWGCRSFIVPLLVSDARGMTTSDLGAVLDSMPDSQADSLFGRGRLALWRAGDITTSQLLP